VCNERNLAIKLTTKPTIHRQSPPKSQYRKRRKRETKEKPKPLLHTSEKLKWRIGRKKHPKNPTNLYQRISSK
jgi:hypothetical protein